MFKEILLCSFVFSLLVVTTLNFSEPMTPTASCFTASDYRDWLGQSDEAKIHLIKHSIAQGYDNVFEGVINMYCSGDCL